MNDNLKILVEELRKLPEDEHCTGYLKDANGKLCVHGVMCDVYSRLTGEGRWITDPRTYQTFVLPDGSRWSTSSPPIVQQFFGVSPQVDDEDDADDEDVLLMRMNDGDGLSFFDIAAAIESAPPFRVHA